MASPSAAGDSPRSSTYVASQFEVKPLLPPQGQAGFAATAPSRAPGQGHSSTDRDTFVRLASIPPADHERPQFGPQFANTSRDPYAAFRAETARLNVVKITLPQAPIVQMPPLPSLLDGPHAEELQRIVASALSQVHTATASAVEEQHTAPVDEHGARRGPSLWQRLTSRTSRQPAEDTLRLLDHEGGVEASNPGSRQLREHARE